jgi:hypothetical protein
MEDAESRIFHGLFSPRAARDPSKPAPAAPAATQAVRTRNSRRVLPCRLLSFMVVAFR